jgi:predicted lipoprotein with Yx(FWY)xxD motif
MRTTFILLAALILAVAVGAYLIPGHKAQPAGLAAMLATPPGITLHNMVEQHPVPYNLLSTVKGPFRFGDAKGMTAYVSDADTVAGKSSCEGDCAVKWPAIPAPPGAEPVDDWTIVVRADGTRQWAYRGKPLYTSAEDKAWGQLKGDHVDGVWHVAAPVWAGGAQLPPDIGIAEIGEALGQGLVDDRGLALYTGPADGAALADCAKAPCAHDFHPYQAPQIDRNLGDFTTVDRTDGVRQWVYKGLPLYTYDGDVRLDDANGIGVDPRFEVALVARYFVPDQVALRPDEKLGGVWTTKAGMSLYMRDMFRYTASGAHSARQGDPGLPQIGRAVGLLGCDAACEQKHPPLIAPEGSEPSGYWTVYARADGRHQWAYAGYALYTATADSKPGDLLANDDYDVLRVETVALRSVIDPYGAGLYWHVATP